MSRSLTRRQFLQSAAVAVPALALAPSLPAASDSRGFSFVLLGDLHFDRLEHHDLLWLRTNKPNDVRQVEDYTRITREITPQLFSTVRDTISDLTRSEHARTEFVLQVGDLVEGLCGSEELALRQNSEVLAFVRDAKLGVPFLFTKGNHDITGYGAKEAFQTAFHPFINEQSRSVDPTAKQSKACSAFRQGNALFCCFDAYDGESLPWLEAVLAKRTEQHCFVVIHPPVAPYGARSTWHVYSNTKQKPEREKILQLLGDQNAFVLGGHIHKFNVLVRKAGRGRFLQLAVSSIIRTLQIAEKNVLTGVADYTGDQIKVEPTFSPATEAERRAVYATEGPFVTHFEYADLPGYAVVTVNGPAVEAKIFSGTTRTGWRTVRMSDLLPA